MSFIRHASRDVGGIAPAMKDNAGPDTGKRPWKIRCAWCSVLIEPLDCPDELHDDLAKHARSEPVVESHGICITCEEAFLR